MEAGKSTLMKILSGAYTKDEGEILVMVDRLEINSPQKGKKYRNKHYLSELTIVPD